MTLLAALVGVLLSIALFCMKVMLTASLDVVFAIGPLAIALWVLPEAAWLARFVSRVLAALLVWPIVWVVCFAVFGAIGVESLTPDGAGETLVKPFVAIALLYLCLKLPFAILDATSLLDGPGGGFVSGTARYVAGRTLYDRLSTGGRERAQAGSSQPSGGPGLGGGGGGGSGGPPRGGDRPGGGTPPTGASPARERTGAGALAPDLVPGLAASAAALAAEPVVRAAGAASGREREQRGGDARPQQQSRAIQRHASSQPSAAHRCTGRHDRRGPNRESR